MIAVALAAAAWVSVKADGPFLPPNNPEVKAMIYRQLPDPNANTLRLCVEKGRVCAFHHQDKATGLRITMPLGSKRK